MRFRVALKRLASAVQLRPWPPHSKEVSGITSCPPSPLSVRYFSARFISVPGSDDGEGLKHELPFAQSAFSPLLSASWLKDRSEHCPCRSRAILADTVGITLQGQLNITVATQVVCRFRISYLQLKSDTLSMAICSSCSLSRGWTVLQMKH